MVLVFFYILKTVSDAGQGFIKREEAKNGSKN
jgi:hypothetical protein